MAFPHFIKTTAVVGISILSTFAGVTVLQAQTEASIEASHRVNIAGRQRMLSQRITMAACFIQKNVDVERQNQVLSDSLSLLADSHNALRNGDAAHGLSVEKIDSVLAALDLVDEQIQQFLPLAENGVGFANAASVSELDVQGLIFLAAMNSAVNRIALDYGDIFEELPLILSVTIDVAGRQRMLSQKAAKEFCLIDSDIEVAANREKLVNTIMIFSNTLDALVNGYPGLVISPPNDRVLAKLQEVEAAWLVPSSVLKRVASGGGISEVDRRIVSTQMDLVLSLMNEAVGMYEIGN